MTDKKNGKVINLECYKIKKKYENLINLYNKLISFFKQLKRKKHSTKYKNTIK